MGMGGKGERRRMHNAVSHRMLKSKEAQGNVFKVSHSLWNEFSFCSWRSGRLAVAQAELCGGRVHPQPALCGHSGGQEVSEAQQIHVNLEEREITRETA